MVSREGTTGGDPDTRLRILDAAREVAESMGPGMRMGDVAARAGVSRQAVYLHFGDRPGLVLALLEHLQQVYAVHAMTDGVARAKTASARMRRLVDLLATLHGHVDRVGWLFDEAQHLDEAFGRDWRNRAGGIHRFVQQQVRSIAREFGLARGWNTRSATDFVFALTSFGSWRELTRDLGWSHERYVRQVHRWLLIVLPE